MSQSRKEIISLIRDAGKYSLLEENNQGMNAYAFSAKHIPLNRDVFLKIYDACPDLTDVFKEPRLLVELTNKPHGGEYLVNVLDTEKLNSDWILVAMEFVAGGSLLDIISKEPLPLMDAINVSKDILYGLSNLHDANLVHRDIKPANIMLASQNGRLHPKLGDFGSVARLVSKDLPVSASKHSALYVPSEGWEDPSQYYIQSDIYQVGLVFAELINGSLNYDNECYIDKQAKIKIKELGATCLKDLEDFNICQIVNDAIARRSKSRQILSTIANQPYVNREIKKIINKSTHPDYSRRYGSAIEMANALNNIFFPNWKSKNDHFIANNWKGWDWLIKSYIKGSTENFFVMRSRKGNKKFRKFMAVSSLQDAFRSVYHF